MTNPSAAAALPRLDRLIADLRRARLQVSIDEAVDAARLVEHLSLTVAPAAQDLRRLQPALRAVLCKSASQRDAFDTVYTQWLQAEAPVVPAPDAENVGGRLGPGEIEAAGWNNLRIIGTFAAILVLAVLLVMLWPLLRNSPQAVEAPTTIQPLPPAVTGGSALPTPTTASPEPQDLPLPQFFAAQRENEEVRPLWLVLLLLSLLPLPLLWGPAQALWLSRRHARETKSLRPWPPSRYLKLLVAPLAPALQAQLLQPVIDARGDGRDYARRRRLHRRRSVEATMASQGLPRLHFHPAYLHPAYRVLVQAARDDDYGVLWSERLRGLGIRVEIFRFEVPGRGEIPTCIEVGGSRRFGFDRIPPPLPGQRLLLISALDLLFDGARPYAWLRLARLERWPERALFTPEEPRFWLPAQVAQLERRHGTDLGMYVMPLDDSALAAWGEWLVQRRLPLIVLSDLQRFPLQLARHEARYVDPELPKLADAEKLVDQLQAYLGRNGFYWLCVCAIPPVLDRRLSLLLGEEYFLRLDVVEDERMRLYMHRSWRLLVRLPWIRDETQIPHWLRVLLLRRLPPAIFKELRGVLRGVLHPPTEETTGSASPAAQVTTTPSDTEAGACEALYADFLDDALDAEELLLRCPPELQAWLQPLQQGRAHRAGLRQLFSRWTRRDGHLQRYVFAAAGVVLAIAALILGAALSRAPEQWGDLDRNALYRESVNQLTADTPRRIDALAFGDQIVATASGARVQLWDAERATPVGEPYILPEPIRRLSISRDDALVAALLQDASIVIFRPAVDAQRVRFRPVNPAIALAFGDGRELVTQDAAGSFSSWDVGTGTALQPAERRPRARCADAGSASALSDGGIRSAVISATGALALCTQTYGAASSDPADGGIVTAQRVALAASGVVATAVSDRGQAAYLQTDGTVHVAFVRNGVQTDTPAATPHSISHPDARQIAFSADGRKLITASAHQWRLWTSLPTTEPVELNASAAAVTSLSADGETVALVEVSDPSAVKLLATGDGRQLATLPVEGTPALLTFERGSSRLIYVTEQGRFYRSSGWGAYRFLSTSLNPGLETPADVGTPEWDRSGWLDKEGIGITAARLSPDGMTIAWIPQQDPDGVYRTRISGGPAELIWRSDEQLLSAIAFASDGTLLVAGSRDLRRIDATNGALRGPVVDYRSVGVDAPAREVQFSPDGAYAVVTGATGARQLWNLQQTRVSALESSEDDGSGASDQRKLIAFSPDSRRFAVAYREALTTQPRGYWVFVPAMASREQALGVARQLSAKGVRDYYVITAGDQQNTISLGLFREQANAERRRAEIAALGFTPQILPRTEEPVVSESDGNHTVRIWDSSNVNVLTRIQVADAPSGPPMISPDGNLLAVPGRQVSIWDLPSGQLRGIAAQSTATFSSVEWSADGKHLLAIPAANSPRSEAAPRWLRIPQSPAPEIPGAGLLQRLRDLDVLTILVPFPILLGLLGALQLFQWRLKRLPQLTQVAR